MSYRQGRESNVAMTGKECKEGKSCKSKVEAKLAQTVEESKDQKVPYVC